jgi:uroporphyrinogen-III synthase
VFVSEAVEAMARSPAADVEFSSPLHGKRFLVTSPGIYFSRLSELLVDKGARPLWMPTIGVSDLLRPETLDFSLREIEATYSSVIFVSRHAINATLNRMKQIGASISQLNRIEVCAMGKDGDALRENGVLVDERCFDNLDQVSTHLRSRVTYKKVILLMPEYVDIDEPISIRKFLSEAEIDL